MIKEKLLISACLLGENVKYNGKNNLIDNLDKLSDIFDFFAVCPEVMGGMTIPRMPCEIISFKPLKIENEFGIDMVDHFIDGAKQTLALAQQHNIKYALFKANSPSCGNHQIYDGTFSGKLIDQVGVTTKFLIDHNIKVFNENEITKLIKQLKGI
jgi:uncharacterized protein YbbK (DUF523 family)